MRKNGKKRRETVCFWISRYGDAVELLEDLKKDFIIVRGVAMTLSMRAIAFSIGLVIISLGVRSILVRR